MAGLYLRTKVFELTTLILALVALALAVGTGLALFIGTRVARGVSRLAVAARGIARGDVAQDVEVRGRDEVAATVTARSLEGLVGRFQLV